jgi:predicted RNA-binding protein (virulence factor B family)
MLNNILATTVTGIVTDENDNFYYVQNSGVTIGLPKSEGEHHIGDVVTGFVYTDKAQKPRMTTMADAPGRDHYKLGVVTEVRKDLGVFVDVGVPDKDFVVSIDNLPELKHLWPKKGDQLFIKLDVDDKDRIWGLMPFNEDMKQIAGKAYDNMQNQELRAIVYRLKLSGTFVYLPDNNMLGFIHPSERDAEPRLGQELKVRVIGFRKEDRTLNLSLKPRAFEMIDNDAQMILTYLNTVGGFMTLNDKSAPDDIKRTFGISKGSFKKALGGLMKAGKITQDASGTTLVK